MNTNLRKLADKARFVSSPEYPDQDVVFERFAELIIQECADVCNRQAKHYAETNNQASATFTATALGRMIKMHFEGE